MERSKPKAASGGLDNDFCLCLVSVYLNKEILQMVAPERSTIRVVSPTHVVRLTDMSAVGVSRFHH